MASLIYVNVLNVDDIPQFTDPRKVICRVKKGGNTTFIVIQCKALCYRYDTFGRYCVRYSSYYYYYYSTYWSSTRIIGSAAGGGISLIVCIVVIVCFCRYCNRRQAYAGSTIVNNQSVSTVTTSQQQQQQQGFSAPYYPQQPGYQPQYTYPTYPAGQPTYPAGQPTYPTGQPTYPTSQPPQQPPMAGYSNNAFSPPSYEQAAYQTKPNEQPTAPMQ